MSEIQNSPEKTKFEFSEQKWRDALSRVDWYVRLEEDLKLLLSNSESEEREKVYAIVEQYLSAGRIPLGSSEYDWDAERLPIDTAVVHHSSQPGDTSLTKLSAIGMVRIYGPRFASTSGDPMVRGQAVESGHFKDGKQVFFTYHWIVRPDGSAERLLEDNYIGWHAGNWEVNRRSVGIVLSGDFEKEDPPQIMLDKGLEIIKQYSVVPSRVLGHREVNNKTNCPGETFLSSWKNKLEKT